MPDKGLKKKYRELLRSGINRRNRERLRNTTPTVIANNCNGGVISHDLGLQFRTPTVNLYIPFPDYVRFCEGLGHYLALSASAMSQGEASPEGCPTGVLEDIRLVFVHYPTFEAARDKWFERAARVDMGNLFLMLAQRDGCTTEDVHRFDALPFEHKVAFVAEPMPETKSAVYLPEFVQDGQVRVLSDYISRTSGRRIIDSFDYVRFLNGESY
jgi:uncharacterized protein (DUF1919 family)